MEEYLNSLDTLYNNNNNNNNNLDDSCCNNHENHSISHEKISCRICGANIENISYLPEKSYENKNNSHHGMPVNELLPGTNLGSVVSGSHYKNYNMRLVQQVNNYTSMTYKDRSVMLVFNQITECCKRHDINEKIIDEAKGIYKHISSKKISRGSNRLGIIASCVFLAAKNTGNPRSSKEISKVFDCDSKVVTKGIKTVNDIMRMHKLENRVKKDRVNYSDLISRFCNHLNLDGKQINEIHDLSNKILEEHKNELSSCTPSSLSASFIYYYIHLNNLDISKKDISDNTGISVVTIQKVVNIIIKLYE
jgi:transcription initiation factor TFIIB